MSKIILLITLFLTSLSSWGQIEFEERVLVDYLPVPNGPNAVEPADIDGDGDLDLLVSSADFRVSWWENLDGKGNFGERHYVNDELIFGVVSGKAGDIDGDGDLDVVIGATLDVWWFENLDGKGHFGPQQRVSGRDGTKSLDLRDFDDDGFPDLVISTSIFNSDEVIAFKNYSGTLSQVQVIATRASGIRTVRMQDIDGDGDLDVITSAEISNQGIRWYPNDGNGVFGGVTSVVPFGTKPVGVFAADLNGDNLVDILSASAADSALIWSENLGNNTDFADPVPITQTPVNPEAVWAEDVDSDGDMDILVGASGTDPLRLFVNDGNANFSGPILFPIDPGVEVINSADMDGDGDPDLIVASGVQDLVAWFENLDGQGTFGDYRRVHVARLNGLRTMLFADLDQDGDDDLLTGSEYDGQVAWLEYLGPGVFRPYQTLSFGLKGIQRLLAVDLDGDNDLDLVANLNVGNRIVWLEHLDGNGNFGPVQMIAQTNVVPEDVFVSDLDGDNDPDILAALQEDDEIVWYENLDGQGNFAAARFIDDNNQGSRIVIAADVDGDGDPDVIAGGASIYTYLYINLDGQGNFSDGTLIQTLSNVYSMEAVDLDDDNDLDFVVSTNRGTGSGNVGWIENLDGQGTFSDYQSAGFLQQAISATAADLNQDGRLDLLGAGPAYHKVLWYERVSDSLAFGAEQIISDSARGAQVVLARDFDQDGDIDVFSASVQDNKVAWYDNLRPNGNQIRGAVRYDLDQNGCTAADEPARGILLGASGGPMDIGIATNNNGFYQLFPGEGNYTTRITSALPFFYGSQPLTYSSGFTGFGQIDTADFCLVITSQIDDVAVSIYNITSSRPGFPTSYELVYRNNGATVLSGELSLSYDDSRLGELNTSVAPLDPTANPLVWNYNDLKPFETRTIRLDFRVFPPPTVNIDDSLQFVSTVSPLMDENPADNRFVLNNLVIGSYDPNDITVLEGPEIPVSATDNYLHYLIRFQNTGTAEAINVRVDNLLDERLDWSTFQLEASSHPMIIQTEDERLFKFVFDNIFLPDSSSNFEASNGFIAYRIKPLPAFSIGDTIRNQTDIFFDFNPPIITNEVSTTVIQPVGTSELADSGIELFPNPANEVLYIRSQDPLERVELYDLYGRRLLVSQGSSRIDLSKLTSGTYVVQCYGREGRRSVGRIIKK